MPLESSLRWFCSEPKGGCRRQMFMAQEIEWFSATEWATTTTPLRNLIYIILSLFSQLQNIKRCWLHGTFRWKLSRFNVDESEGKRFPALRQVRVSAEKGKQISFNLIFFLINHWDPHPLPRPATLWDSNALRSLFCEKNFAALTLIKVCVGWCCSWKGKHMKRLTLFAVCELLSANKALWFYPFSSLFLFDDGISKTLHTEGATCRNLPESSFFYFYPTLGMTK